MLKLEKSGERTVLDDEALDEAEGKSSRSVAINPDNGLIATNRVTSCLPTTGTLLDVPQRVVELQGNYSA
jgi:hypothetical protein